MIAPAVIAVVAVVAVVAIVGIGIWYYNTHKGKFQPPGPALIVDGQKSKVTSMSVAYPMVYKIDPSGYVYEGVASNRLEGVKAVIYYEDYPKDEFGQPMEEAGLQPVEWTEAGDYDERNPQFTDAGGEYGWDVPPGRWKVKYTKEGYEEYWTDWMEVPPEYTDVNINLKNLAAPIVETINVYNDRVQVIFSQYMDIPSVGSQAIAVQMDGKNIEGTVQPVEAEYDYGETNQYARIFEFCTKEPLSGEATVTVGGALSYSGVEMESVEKTAPVSVRPEAVEVSLAENMECGSAAEMCIDVVPGEAGSNRTAEVIAKTPAIADVSQHKVILDENGHAQLSVAAKMPGKAVFETRVKGTALRCASEITVSVPEREPELADLADCQAVLEYDTAVYTGKEMKPDVKVTDNGEQLEAGTDYTLVYSNNVNAGTASVTVTGIGNYTGQLDRNFTITKAPNEIRMSQSSYSFEASAVREQAFALKVSAGGQIRYSSDNPCVNADRSGNVLIARNFAGTAIITITAGDNNYQTASAKVTVKVGQINNQISVSNLTRTASKKLQKFTLKVKHQGSGGISYKSNNKYVTVDRNGKVTIAKNFVGRAVVTIEIKASGIYKDAVKNITITVNPAKTKIVRLKSPSSRKMTVKWKKNASVSGYQIQYAANKKFKKAITRKVAKKTKTEVSIPKLKPRKKYYVRVRTYKKVSGKIYYSAWSPVKGVTIRR